MFKPLHFVITASILFGAFSGSALAGNHSGSANHKKETMESSKKDIVSTALAAGKFKTLAKALTEAELVSALQAKGPFTVFAPTDEAFAKVPPATLKALLADKAKLKEVLLYHVVPGDVNAEAAMKLTEAKTLSGKALKISTRDKQVYINGAKVIMPDVKASNGVIHVVDTVILPPANQAAK